MRRQIKRSIAALSAAAMAFSMAACGQTQASESTDESASTDYSGQTVVAQVTAIEGTTVTLQVGELTEEEMDGQAPGGGDGSTGEGGTVPEKPEGESDDASASGDSDDTDTASTSGDSDDADTASTSDSSDSAPEKPDGDNGGTPPEKPDGDDSGSAPEKPDGDDGDAPQMPEGDGGMGGSMTRETFTAGDETVTFDLADADVELESGMETVEATIEDIEVDDILEIVVSNDNTIELVTVKSLDEGGMGGEMAGGAGGAGGGFGGSGEVTQGDAATTITEDGEYTDVSYTSTGDDENALRVDGATVTLSGITVDKSAGDSSNTEDGDFYGMNAALLATNGADVTIEDAVITSSAQNGNGVFSYGSGTIVNISNSTITTTADNSGGIQTTGGGTTNAENLTVDTSGNSAAAIRSDRGGGTVNVDGGTYTSNGYNSPAVYSTAEITVKNAQLTANNSEALVIEGENSITLEDCDVTGNMSDTEGTSSDENVHNIMIYQSMSGDAKEGTSSFSMTGGSLTSQNGDMIFVTNTHCIITLSDVDIVNEDADGYLLNVSGNSASHGWGTAGANGAQVEMTASEQTLEGDIIVDTISTLNLTLSDGSTFTGTINIVDNEEGGTAVDDNAVITIDEGCTWTLTGDCTLTSLENNGTINFNGYTITLADGTVLSE